MTAGDRSTLFRKRCQRLNITGVTLHSYRYACGQQTSVTAGTILHRTHFPLREWFGAAYLVATHTPGMSGTQLQRQMGCSYKTAWYLLH
jgi:hypothetical protein